MGEQELISECADIQEIIPIDELEQFAKIKEIVKGLNLCESARLKQYGHTNECFFNADGSLTKNHTYTIKEKKKYIYLDCGGSGVFMIDKTTGNIFGIKGYGQLNKAKCWGHIQTINVEELHQKRHA